MWVYLTRNERILQALMRERSRFAGLKYEWDEFEQSLETPPRDIFARMNSDLIAEVNDALDEIESLFAEIEAALDKLKDEAVTAFDKLNKAAPESPLVPEAEVLMGYVLSQMEEFDDAENWFKNLKAKYSVYDARVRQMQDEVRTQDDEVALIEDVVAHHAGEPDASTEGLPAEVKTWLAEKEGVGEALAVMDKLTEQSKSIDQMRDMMGDVEKALAVARVEASFPNLARAQQRAAGLKTISIALLAAIDEARGAGRPRSQTPGCAAGSTRSWTPSRRGSGRCARSWTGSTPRWRPSATGGSTSSPPRTARSERPSKDTDTKTPRSRPRSSARRPTRCAASSRRSARNWKTSSCSLRWARST